MNKSKKNKRTRPAHEIEAQVRRTLHNKERQLTKRLVKARKYHREKEVANVTTALQRLY